MMGHFDRLHIVPVGVLGENNSAPHYVRALLVQKNGVGFLDLVEGDGIEPDVGDHSNVFQRHPNIAPWFPVPFAVENEVKVPVTRHRQSLPVADDEVCFLRSWQTHVGAIVEGVPRRAAVPNHGCSAKTFRHENRRHEVGEEARLGSWKLKDIGRGARTRFRATENGGKRTTEIPFILVDPVLSRKGDAVSSLACLLYSSMVATIRCYRRPGWYVITGAAAWRLSNWHRFRAGTAVSAVSAVTVGTTVGAITVATIATTIAVDATAVGTIAVATTVGTTAVGVIAVGTIAVATAVGTTAAGAITAAIAIRACCDIKAAAASRGSREGGSRGGGGGLQGRHRRESAGQVGFECSNASDGRTGHRCRRSLRISTVPCRSWPCGSFARTVHSGAPSRWARAAIPLEATLRR